MRRIRCLRCKNCYICDVHEKNILELGSDAETSHRECNRLENVDISPSNEV